jgi:hypothetical protein
VTAKVEAWGMKCVAAALLTPLLKCNIERRYSGHGLRAYLGRMNEIFEAFPPCDDATRLNLRKAPAGDVRKVYLQVEAASRRVHIAILVFFLGGGIMQINPLFRL